jgi:ankyrin repeat protein
LNLSTRLGVRGLALLFALLSSNNVLAGAYDALIGAANLGDTNTVSALVQRGMDVNSVDAEGNSLLMIAARNSNRPLLEYLLANSANTLMRNKYGESALMLSAFVGDLESVKLLVQSKADLNPAKGWTPLLYSAFNGHLDVARYLVEMGADINAQSESGLTALILAAKNGSFAIAEFLIDRHADPNARDGSGATATDHAIKSGNTRIAELLDRRSVKKVESR